MVWIEAVSGLLRTGNLYILHSNSMSLVPSSTLTCSTLSSFSSPRFRWWIIEISALIFEHEVFFFLACPCLNEGYPPWLLPFHFQWCWLGFQYPSSMWSAFSIIYGSYFGLRGIYHQTLAPKICLAAIILSLSISLTLQLSAFVVCLGLANLILISSNALIYPGSLPYCPS